MISPYVGGGFGGKCTDTPGKTLYQGIAALLARKTGRPVSNVAKVQDARLDPEPAGQLCRPLFPQSGGRQDEAPRRQAAAATSYPIRPDERLPT